MSPQPVPLPYRSSVWVLRVCRLLLVSLLLVSVFTPLQSAGGGASCVEVLREYNRRTRQHFGRVPTLGELGKRLGVPGAIVERCLHSYGRRARREGAEGRESAEALLEDFESTEPEEFFREDVEEPGVRERPVRDPKPRYLSIRPTPGVEEPGDVAPSELERAEEGRERERER